MYVCKANALSCLGHLVSSCLSFLFITTPSTRPQFARLPDCQGILNSTLSLDYTHTGGIIRARYPVRTNQPSTQLETIDAIARPPCF